MSRLGLEYTISFSLALERKQRRGERDWRKSSFIEGSVVTWVKFVRNFSVWLEVDLKSRAGEGRMESERRGVISSLWRIRYELVGPGYGIGNEGSHGLVGAVFGVPTDFDARYFRQVGRR